MVADILVDYGYLVRLIQERSPLIPFVRALQHLSDYDNVRFLIDKDKTHIQNMARVFALHGGNDQGVTLEDRRLRRIVEWFNPQDEMDFSQRFKLVDALSANLSPAPFVAITDSADEREWGRKRVKVDDYFLNNDYEKRRIKIASKRSFGKGMEQCDAFRELIRQFVGSEHSFDLFDRYALWGFDVDGQLNDERFGRRCDTLCRWFWLLSDEFNQACEFHIYANFPHDCIANVRERLVSRLNESCRSLTDNSSQEQVLTFHLIPGNARELQDVHLHDRFVCSKTRVMSIGKGLDMISNWPCINGNLYYCGRTRGDVVIEHLKRIQAQIISVVMGRGYVG